MTEKPSWQTWPLEPYALRMERGMPSVVGSDSATPWRPDEGLLALGRMVACTNALAGIRNPAAVTGLMEAARASVDEAKALYEECRAAEATSPRFRQLVDAGYRLDRSLAALGAEPTDAT